MAKSLFDSFLTVALSIVFVFFLCTNEARAADKNADKKAAGKDASSSSVSNEPAAVPQIAMRGEIFYRWKPHSPVIKANVPEEGVEEFFREVVATAETKEAAVAKLTTELTQAELEAVTHCRQAHENKAACIHAKLNQAAATINALGFQARRVLNESIENDCALSFGTCLAARRGKIEAVESGAALAAAAPAEAEPTSAVAASVAPKVVHEDEPKKAVEEEPSAFGLR